MQDRQRRKDKTVDCFVRTEPFISHASRVARRRYQAIVHPHNRRRFFGDVYMLILPPQAILPA